MLVGTIFKRGWDFLWVAYADVPDQNTMVKQAVAVYVEKVHQEGDLSLLGIGG